MPQINKFVYIILYACALLFTSCTSIENNIPDDLELHNGDIIFRRGNSAASYFVNFADKKKGYTHVGMVIEIEGEFMAIHAVPGEAPQGEIEKIKIEPLEDFFHSDKAITGGIYRTKITSEQLNVVTSEALRFYHKNVPFDNSYNLQDSTEIYCTELITRSFDKINHKIAQQNVTEVDMPIFKGIYIFPSDILKNSELTEVFSY